MLRQPVIDIMSQLGFEKATSRDLDMTAVLRGEITPGQSTLTSFTDATQEYLTRLAMTNYAVYRNIMLIAKIVGEGGLVVQQRGENGKWNTIADHEYSQIVEQRPNPIMSQSFIWVYQLVWLLLWGEAYWMTAEKPNGDIKYMYPIPANRIQPIPNPKATAEVPLLGYGYQPVTGGETEFIPQDRICYHRMPNPFDYWRGLSPLNAYKLGLKISFEAQKTDLEDYTNRLRLQHLLSVKAGMSNREYNVALEDLRMAEANGNRWRLIRAGDFTAKEISPKRSNDSSWIYNLTESQANGIFGIPDGIWSLDANRASSQEHRAILIESTVWPLMRMLAEDHTSQIVVPKYGENYRVIFEDIRPKNREMEIKEEEHAYRKLTFNEVREIQSLPPHPDPDIGNAPFDAAARVAVSKVAKGYSIASPVLLSDIIPDSISESPETSVEMLDDTTALGDEGAKDENPKEVLSNAQVEEPESDFTFKARELKKWRTVTLRLLSENKSITDYDFQSDHLTLKEKADIKAKLSLITDDYPDNEVMPKKKYIKAVFAGKSIKEMKDDFEGEYGVELTKLIEQVKDGLERTEFISEVGILTDHFLLAVFTAGSSNSEESRQIELEMADAKSMAMESAGKLWDKITESDDDLKVTSIIIPWISVIGLFFSKGLANNKANPLLQWHVGPTEHCTDCLANSEQIKRSSEWNKQPLPQDRALECRGYNCQCYFTLVPEEEFMTL
jgi:phage portal protein BeeE